MLRHGADSHFQISQRADYINNDLFEWVQFNRAIINTRDEPLADARKYRTFIGIFSRDKLLPYFKNRREEFLKLGVQMSSGRYIAFAEFFAWYYNTMANQIADTLVAEHRITPPENLYTYAVKAPEQ